jgi:hypothetical protein
LDFGLFDVSHIRAQGEQPKEGAEDIFAFGDPGDRFDVQGMQGKESGDQRTQPELRGQAVQEEQEKQGVGNMEQHTGQVVAGGIESVELAVEHVGEPGQGVPIVGIDRGECP